jgi:drug/metabolite transporter (DMT)-like permease
MDWTIAAVLCAALAHASWNALVKNSGDRFFMLASIRLVGLGVGIGLALIVPFPDPAAWPFLVSAAACHYIYFALLLQSYRVGDMSQAYPIARGTAPMLVTLLGAMLIGEMPSALTWLAIAMICLGILAISLSATKFNGMLVMFALATGVTITGYSFLSGVGIRRTTNWLSYIAWLEILFAAGMVGYVAIRYPHQGKSFLSQQWPTAMIAGILSVGGYSIALWAMTKNTIGTIVALRETSVIFAALIGSIFLGEGFAVKRIIAATLVAAGVILIAWSK